MNDARRTARRNGLTAGAIGALVLLALPAWSRPARGAPLPPEQRQPIALAFFEHMTKVVQWTAA